MKRSGSNSIWHVVPAVRPAAGHAVQLEARDVVRHGGPPVGWCAGSRSDLHQPQLLNELELRCGDVVVRDRPLEPAQGVEHVVNT